MINLLPSAISLALENIAWRNGTVAEDAHLRREVTAFLHHHKDAPEGVATLTLDHAPTYTVMKELLEAGYRVSVHILPTTRQAALTISWAHFLL